MDTMKTLKRQKKNILKISQTERIALTCGTIGLIELSLVERVI